MIFKRSHTARLCVWLLAALPLFAHAEQRGGLRYVAEASAGMAAGERAPFWLVAGRHGIYSLQRRTAALSAGLFREADTARRLTYSFGAELAGGVHLNSDIFLQQAYAELHYGAFALSVGMRERGSEMKDDRLSSGGMTLSANARPVAQARIEIPRYAPFPFTGGWLHVKGHLAYGRFSDGRFQRERTAGAFRHADKVLYHSKALMLRIGNDRFPFVAEVGMEMAAQFGGEIRYPDGTVLHAPHRLKDFLRVLLPGKGGEGATASDAANFLGNQVGSYHLALAYRRPEWGVRLYYEHFFEDKSGMTFRYGVWRDCLAGLEIRFPRNAFVEGAVVEYLCTRHQSGAFHYFGDETLPGVYTGIDNYYNHGEYPGWEHYGHGMGNPLILGPLYNADGKLDFRSNRVRALHAGIGGRPARGVAYRLLFTASTHWGTYSLPYDRVRRQRSALLEVSYAPPRWSGWSFTLAAALDRGEATGRNTGAMLTIRKTGMIFRRR